MWPQIFLAVAYYLLRMRIFEIALFRLHYLLFYLFSLINKSLYTHQRHFCVAFVWPYKVLRDSTEPFTATTIVK